MVVNRGPWSGRARFVGTGLVVSWILVPLMTVLWVAPSTRDLATAASVTDLITYPALLMGALLLYVHTRVAPGVVSPGLATAAVFGTSQGVAYAVLRLALPDPTQARPGWLMLLELVVAGVLVALLASGDRLRQLGDPLVVGLGLGAVVSAARLVLVTVVEPLPADLKEQTALLGVLVLLVHLAAAGLVLRGGHVPRSAAVPLASVWALLALSHLLTYPTPPPDARSLVAVITDLVGAVLFCTTAWRLLQGALAGAARLEVLQELLEVAEAEVRQDRTVLHQVASAAAGITTVSQLLASGQVGDAAARDRMMQLLAAESARLQRLSAGPEQGAGLPTVVDLDQALAPLLVAHAVRGRTISWRPSGLRALGCPDRVAEVVGILLDNCALHSGAASVRVDVAETSEGVTVTVSDDGRGIDDDVIARGFPWGGRGAGSSGQGIGLHHAHRLAAELNGTLTVAGARGHGTSVTLTLRGVPADLALRGEPRGA
jgi:signal transduction histidine kinase